MVKLNLLEQFKIIWIANYDIYPIINHDNFLD